MDAQHTAGRPARGWLSLGGLCLATALALAAGPASGHDARHEDAGHDAGHDAGAQPSAQTATPASGAPTKVRLVDMELLDQDGQPTLFASEAIGDRIVVVATIYTSCTTVCPVSAAIMQQVQQRMSPGLSRDVRMVAVSVDPTTDTPRRLREFSDKFKLSGDWKLLTGKLQHIQRVVDGLGVYTAVFEDHPAMILVGDGRTGEWSRFYGFPGPSQILAQVRSLSEQRLLAAKSAQ